MKTNAKILSILFATTLTTINLSSCQDFIYENDVCNQDPVKGDQVAYYYMAFHVFDAASASGSRAAFDSDNDDISSASGKFNHGLASEYALYKPTSGTAPHYFLIFGGDNNLKSVSPIDFLDEDSNGTYDHSLVDENTGYAKYQTLYTKVNGEIEGWNVDITTDKILVVLNANSSLYTKLSEAATAKKSYNDVCKIIVSGSSSDFLFYPVTSGSSTTKYFTMSSSMIVKDSSVEPAIVKEMNGNELKFYTTIEEAKANPSVIVYVERLQAKYNVLFKQKDTKSYCLLNASDLEGSDNLEENGVTKTSSLILTPTNFDFSNSAGYGDGLKVVSSYTRNASIEETGQLQKIGVKKGWKVNITGWNVNGTQKSEYIFKNLNPSTNYYTNWNNFPTIRNFWAEDPNYSSGRSFPDQYRWANGVTPYITKEQEEADTDPAVSWTLNYFDYSQLAQKSIRQYSPESTFAASILGNEAKPEDKAHMRAGTHVIVTAQLLVEGIDSDAVYGATSADGLITGAADKYYMKGMFWSGDAYKEYVAEYLGYYASGSVDRKFYVVDTESSAETTVYKVATSADFEIEPVNIKGGDGYGCIKPATGTTLYVLSQEEIPANGDTPAQPAQYTAVNDFNTIRDAHPEFYAGVYTNGMMYYPVAVRHNTANNSSTSIATGDYGSVRNHWYTFTVTNISAPGIPVHKDDQQIIPNNEPVIDALGVNVSVLPWHDLELPVDIGGQRPGQEGEDSGFYTKPDQWQNQGGTVSDM